MTLGRNIVVEFNESKYVVESPMMIQAQVTKDGKSTAADSAQIQLFNLAHGTRSGIIEDDTKVKIYAGYSEQKDLLFIGDIQFVTSHKEDTEWITNIVAGDGATAMKKALLDKTYSDGVKLDTIIRDAANAIGGGDPELLDVQFQHQPGRGVTITGSAQETLTKNARNANAVVNIQDGGVVVAGPKGKRSVTGYNINIKTGMVGVPEWMNLGQDYKQLLTLNNRRIKVTSLCIPSIKPFDKVHITSDKIEFKDDDGKASTVDHVFTVDRVDHSLNSREGNFQTTVEAIFHD